MSSSYQSFLLPVLIAVSLSSIVLIGAGGQPLEEPILPKIPQVVLPQPALPKPELPAPESELPKPELPAPESELPKPELPQLPKLEVPKLPELPELPKPELPNFGIPHLPDFPQPSFPGIPDNTPRDVYQPLAHDGLINGAQKVSFNTFKLMVLVFFISMVMQSLMISELRFLSR